MRQSGRTERSRQRCSIQYLDEHDPVSNNVDDQHAIQRDEIYTPMARAMRPTLRVVGRSNALARGNATVAPANQTNAPHTDSRLRFARIPQEGNQLGD